jgi:hypothetical protein
MRRSQPQRKPERHSEPGELCSLAHTTPLHNPTLPEAQFSGRLCAGRLHWQRLDVRGNNAVASITFLTILLFGLSSSILGQASKEGESGLAVVQAGVQDSEDAPFVAPNYQFLPGELVYFEFQVSGFATKNEANEVKRISLSYVATAMDQNDLPLAAPASGDINVEINPQDKNWTPKRRASFQIPGHVAAGEFHIRVQVKDLIGKTGTSRDFPFRMGGVKIQPANSITVENWRFLRDENDREPLQLPAYRAGDTIFIKFEMAGYKLGPHNDYHLTYGIKVLRQDGSAFLDAPNAADLQSDGFYPAQFVPGNFNITTSKDTSLGEYTVLLSVHDLLANKSSEIRQVFRIE